MSFEDEGIPVIPGQLDLLDQVAGCGCQGTQHRHGTRAMYNSRAHRCRCEACKEANRLYTTGVRGSVAPRGAARPTINYSKGWTSEELAYLETDEAKAFIAECRGVKE